MKKTPLETLTVRRPVEEPTPSSAAPSSPPRRRKSRLIAAMIVVPVAALVVTAAALGSINFPSPWLAHLSLLGAGPDEIGPTVQPWDGGERWFNGRPIRTVRTINIRTTAYSPDPRSCGPYADGVTASGYSVWTNGTKLVAADTRILPFGTLVSIPGYASDNAVPVLDRGGAIKGYRLDLLFPTHEAALQWGIRDLPVTVWEYADGKPNDFRPGW